MVAIFTPRDVALCITLPLAHSVIWVGEGRKTKRRMSFRFSGEGMRGSARAKYKKILKQVQDDNIGTKRQFCWCYN